VIERRGAAADFKRGVILYFLVGKPSSPEALTDLRLELRGK
jgi:hypothetical protein